MTDKNRRKLQAKKARNFWTCARPVTQIVPNKADGKCAKGLCVEL